MLNKLITLLKLFLGLILIIFIAVFLARDFISPQDGIFYIIKRVQEKIILNIQASPTNKAQVYNQLLEIRLKELTQILDRASEKYLITASLRYYTTAGELVDLAIANKLDSQIPIIEKQLTKHRIFLKKAIKKYGMEGGGKEIKWIQDDVNYLDLSIKKLSEYSSS